MATTHAFRASLSWPIPRAEASNPTSHHTSKNHILSIDGKPPLHMSAAKSFKGDPQQFNPEDLLLSSLMSCHMMSYLYVCRLHQIEICSYQDHAEAILEVLPDGSGHITAVFLNPVVIIADTHHIELALSLHQQANKLCFIANSCNFPIHHQATCTSYSG